MLYGKLFTVMGILWIFECIHYLVHGDHTNMECLSSSEFFLGIIGCINLFRGSLIFFIFVCKDSTINKVNLVQTTATATDTLSPAWKAVASQASPDLH